MLNSVRFGAPAGRAAFGATKITNKGETKIPTQEMENIVAPLEKMVDDNNAIEIVGETATVTQMTPRQAEKAIVFQVVFDKEDSFESCLRYGDSEQRFIIKPENKKETALLKNLWTKCNKK